MLYYDSLPGSPGRRMNSNTLQPRFKAQPSDKARYSKTTSTITMQLGGTARNCSISQLHRDNTHRIRIVIEKKMKLNLKSFDSFGIFSDEPRSHCTKHTQNGNPKFMPAHFWLDMAGNKASRLVAVQFDSIRLQQPLMRNNPGFPSSLPPRR
jgi:hypothetical protein